MAMTTTGNPASVADRLQTYFSKRLLEIQVDELRLAEFGMTAELPTNAGSKTIRWFKFSPVTADLRGGPENSGSGYMNPDASTALISRLTEGVAISTYTENASTYVESTLIQYGQATKISDVLRLIDLFNPLKQNIEKMGRDAALYADTLIRNAVIVGLAGQTGSEKFANVAWATTSTATFDTFNDAPTNVFTRTDALKCVTQLAANKAPKIRGRYVCIIPPQLMHDLRKDTTVVAAMTQVDTGKLYKGWQGSLDGVDYVEATNPWREASGNGAYGTYSATGAVYSALFLGKDAFGVPKMAGTNSPFKPQVFVNDKPEKTDPANQYVIAAWKAFYTAKTLDPLNAVQLRAFSSFN